MEETETIYEGARYMIPDTEMRSWFSYMRNLSVFIKDAGHLQIEFSDKFSKFRVNPQTRMKAKLISAFPGTGKTYYYNNGDKITLDSDSSTFDKSDFPANYIRHIKDNLDKADVILISSHKEVRDALVKEGLRFTLVYPLVQLQKEYIQRFKDRGSPEGFIKLVESQWFFWINELELQKGCDHIVLESGEYLIDAV